MSEDPGELQRFYAETVEPLVAYDDQYETDLVQTLETFLECDGNVANTASRLFTHRHTVRYRLERVRDLSGARRLLDRRAREARARAEGDARARGRSSTARSRDRARSARRPGPAQRQKSARPSGRCHPRRAVVASLDGCPRHRALLAFLLVVGGGLGAGAAPAAAACGAPANAIEAENCRTGNPASEWDVSGAGSRPRSRATPPASASTRARPCRSRSTRRPRTTGSTSTGWATPAAWARGKITTIQPSASLPQNQPGCQTTASTGLGGLRRTGACRRAGRCRRDAVSGIYLAKLVREDGTAGSSHMVFVVRDDDGRSELLFQTSDTTWQAYNQYGGNSL